MKLLILSLSLIALPNPCSAMDKTVQLPGAIIIRAHLHLAGLPQFADNGGLDKSLAHREVTDDQIDREIKEHLERYYGHSMESMLYPCFAKTAIKKSIKTFEDNKEAMSLLHGYLNRNY